jgi:flagellar hook assembly protein FlgD
MSWLKKSLIGLGIALALLITILAVIGFLTPSRPATQALTMTVGNHSVTVAGHYKDLTQESTADGVKVMVDGHKITLDGDQLTMDGKTQVLEPDQNVTIYVDEKGGVDVKIEQESAADSGSE